MLILKAFVAAVFSPSSPSSSPSNAKKEPTRAELAKAVNQVTLALGLIGSICESVGDEIPEDKELTVEQLKQNNTALLEKLAEISKQTILPQKIEKVKVNPIEVPTLEGLRTTFEGFKTDFEALMLKIAGLKLTIKEEFKVSNGSGEISNDLSNASSPSAGSSASTPPGTPVKATSVPTSPITLGSLEGSPSRVTSVSNDDLSKDASNVAATVPTQLDVGAQNVKQKIEGLIADHNALIERIKGIIDPIQAEIERIKQKIEKRGPATLTPEECIKFSKLLNGADPSMIQDIYFNKNSPKLEDLKNKRGELEKLCGEINFWKKGTLSSLQTNSIDALKANVNLFKARGEPHGWFVSSAKDPILAAVEFTEPAKV